MGQKSKFITETSFKTKLPNRNFYWKLKLADVDVPDTPGLGVDGDSPRPHPGLPPLHPGAARPGGPPRHPGVHLSQPQPRPGGWAGRHSPHRLPHPRHPRHHRVCRRREGEQDLSHLGEEFYCQIFLNILNISS